MQIVESSQLKEIRIVIGIKDQYMVRMALRQPTIQETLSEDSLQSAQYDETKGI
jgi:hypothetical protein